MTAAAHDLVAIGCGPFNLGLAALATRVPELDVIALEANPELRWHPGLLFDDALLQLSFLADLVMLVDPTHPLSFLAYLAANDRMYPFFIREQLHPTRREYEDYLRWAAAQLTTVRFSHRVEAVAWDAARARFGLDVVRAGGERVRISARDLVIGIGTEPATPAPLAALPARRHFHGAAYLERTADIERARHVTVIGSGQSAAEIVLDLLRRNAGGGPAVSWLTRTASFAPLDDTKLVLEMTTPQYVRYFHGLRPDVKDRLVRAQWQHYKGISTHTIEAIHDALYRRELMPGLTPVHLRCGVAVEGAELRGDAVVLRCVHGDTGDAFEHETELVVSATGYRERRPDFLAPLEPLLRRDERGRYRIRLDHSIELDPAVTGRIFVANAELHTHGVATPDLGVGAVRNATILNTVTGREVFRLPRRTAFTTFVAPAPGPAAAIVAAPLAAAAPAPAPALGVVANGEPRAGDPRWSEA